MSFYILLVYCAIPPPPDPPLPNDALLVPDPRRNITCLGDQSDIPWNLGENYDRVSMQQLCAHPFYGGSPAPHNFGNIGGYCQSNDVFFSRRLGDHASLLNVVGSVRNLLECRTRCFCNYGLADPLEQPKAVAVTRKTFDPPFRHPRYTIAVDRREIARIRRPAKATRMYINHLREDEYPPWRLHLQYEDAGILQSNRIECAGHLPDFPLPPPFNGHDFTGNQALCAVQLSGGNPAANAGGYCHRTEPITSAERVVSFADDMTPRLDWTWSATTGSSFFLMASIRFHCWKNCLCIDRTKKKSFLDPQVAMWQWLVKSVPREMLSTGTGNPFPMGSSTDAIGRPRTSSKGGNAPSVECAASPDSSKTCALPWPVEILGPVPKELLKLSPPKPPMVGWESERKCGNSCSSNNDCGSDCLCRIPSVEEAKILGVDPVVPRALCLDIGSIFG